MRILTYHGLFEVAVGLAELAELFLQMADRDMHFGEVNS